MENPTSAIAIKTRSRTSKRVAGNRASAFMGEGVFALMGRTRQ